MTSEGGDISLEAEVCNVSVQILLLLAFDEFSFGFVCASFLLLCALGTLVFTRTFLY